MPSKISTGLGIGDLFSVKTKRHPRDTYRTLVVSLAAELDHIDTLPTELQYIETKRPDLFERLRTMISGHKAIGIRTVTFTPPEVLHAVNELSVRCQHRTIITWLPHLLWSQEEPVILDSDRTSAREHGVDLDECVEAVVRHRLDFKKFVLVDEANEGISPKEQQLIDALNDELYPLTIHYIVKRITSDNAHERTAIAQAIIKALIIIGPVTHLLETVSRGIGKVFAASTDDVLSEVAELYALRGSGFRWKELARRLKLLLPILVLATYGAFQVEHFIEQDRMFVAGALFGISAVALSLFTAIVSIKLYHENIVLLIKENKHAFVPPKQQWKLAFLQDFTNPSRLGLLLGAIASPIIGGIVFVFFPFLTHNGWVLALLGSTETIVAGITVLAARTAGEWHLGNQLRSAITAVHRGKAWEIAEKYPLVK